MSDLDKGLRIGILDIETTALEAQHGYLLCACIKEVLSTSLSGKTYTFRIDDHENTYDDRNVVKATIAAMNGYDLIIGWYSSRFDIPFLNTRALKHGLIPPVKNYRRDLCLCARGFGKLKNNKLATWDKYLNKKTEKTFLEFETWIKAMRGDKKSLDYIVHHCQKDVLITEKVYKRFMPLLGKLRRG